MSEDEPTVLKLSEADWNWLQALLDRPARVLPKLAALLREESPWIDNAD